MEHFVTSSDGQRIRYELTGAGDTAVVFVHGWLGNASWWHAQRDHLAGRYTVALVDLPGHGGSDKTRTQWSPEQYGADIKAVTDDLAAPNIILVGHSMSGAWVCVAAPTIPRTRAVILVDTLKNVEQKLPPAQVEQMLALYRRDFRAAVENVLPPFLFSPDTPADVRARLQREFLATEPELAAQILEPLYRMDIAAAARRVTVPVRAINSDYTPTDADTNRRHLHDYSFEVIAHAGHYPMLERPDAVNAALDRVLAGLR